MLFIGALLIWRRRVRRMNDRIRQGRDEPWRPATGTLFIPNGNWYNKGRKKRGEGWAVLHQRIVGDWLDIEGLLRDALENSGWLQKLLKADPAECAM